jgi:hypothetical protein
MALNNIQLINGRLIRKDENDDSIVVIHLYIRDVHPDHNVKDEIVDMIEPRFLFYCGRLDYEEDRINQDECESSDECETIDQIVVIAGRFNDVHLISFHAITACYGIRIEILNEFPAYSEIKEMIERLGNVVRYDNDNPCFDPMSSIRQSAMKSLKYDILQIQRKIRRGGLDDPEEAEHLIGVLKSELKKTKEIQSHMKSLKPRVRPNRMKSLFESLSLAE